MIKTTFCFLLICFPLFSSSQTLIEDVKSKVWISSSNDKLIINDSTVSILGHKMHYQVVNEKLILNERDGYRNNRTNESITIIPGKDSLIVQVQNLQSLMEKTMFKPDFEALKKQIIHFQNHLKDNFNNRLVFYDSTQLDRFKKDLFVKIKISRFPTKLTIDSVGNVSIISSDYSSFFMVNKGNYLGKLDSTKFNNLKEYLFNSKLYSMKHWGFYEKDFTTRSDSRPIDLYINSKMNKVKHEYHGEEETYRRLISLIISDDYPNNLNLKLKQQDTLVKHELIKINNETLQKGVESVSGKLEFIKEDRGQFLYSLKVDSIYSERGVQTRIEKNNKIYCISSNDYKKFSNKQIGLILIKKVAYHTSPLNPLTKDKKLYYYEIVRNFSTSNSIFFEYFGLYNPRGMGRGLGEPMFMQRWPKRKGIFNMKSEKFNTLEKEIYKRKNIAQQEAKTNAE